VSERTYEHSSSNGPSGPRASFGRRLVAYILDYVIIAIPGVILFAIFGRAAGYALWIALAIAYNTYFEGGPTGQTLGKRALGIRVYDFTRGGPIGYGRGFVRWIGKLVSGLLCGLGFLWMLWDKEKQAWDDKFATTVVVPVADYPVN
jgi:uncharacterized RDD family membrane protein YckC